MTPSVPRLGVRESPSWLIEREARRRTYGQISAPRVTKVTRDATGQILKPTLECSPKWVASSAFTEMDERSLTSR
jgi:hypothetical protein